MFDLEKITKSKIGYKKFGQNFAGSWKKIFKSKM